MSTWIAIAIIVTPVLLSIAITIFMPDKFPEYKTKDWYLDPRSPVWYMFIGGLCST